MIRIGIGITTYQRPEHLKLCLDSIDKWLHPSSLLPETEINVYYYEDKDRKGIAYGKNMCLYNLKDCDHIFLFDDDVFIKAYGLIDYFINSGYEHACYMNNKYQPAYRGEKHTSYMMCAGCFIYLTKKTFETVGYFNPAYGLYGYEHAGYCHRIYEAGLTPSRFICLNDTNKYIHSLDLDGIKGYEFLNHKRTITEEERTESVRANNSVYHDETTSHQIYYDFIP